MSLVRDDITINMMVRNEAPHIWYGLMSTLSYVNHAVIVDTGSTDGTVDLILEIQKRFPFVEFLQIPCDDSTINWSEPGRFVPNYKLCEVRNQMLGMSKTKWIWIQDGDEIYPNSAAENLLKTLDQIPADTRMLWVPLYWFVKDLKHIDNPPAYPHTGRVFLREGLSFKGFFPREMSYYGDEPNTQGYGDPRTYMIPATPENHMYHYEMVVKPWRQIPRGVVEFNGEQPEVFFGERPLKGV